MWTFGPIGFAMPWLLLALLALPVLWLLLRAVPPAPIRQRFPGVALLLGLTEDQAETDRTPWWLLLLRMLALAAAIIGFAGPVVNPPPAEQARGPLLVVLDGTWADARDWATRREYALGQIDRAGQAGRPVAVLRLTDAPEAVVFQVAPQVAERLAALEPSPWAPADMAAWIKALPEGRFDTLWLPDGLDHPGRAALAADLAGRGQLSVLQGDAPVLALRPARFADGMVRISALRQPAGGQAEVTVVARGPDPAGVDRELGRAPLTFAAGAAQAETAFALPPELRNRITRFDIEGLRSAGAVSLADDSLKRRKVAIFGGRDDREGLQLLSPTHYLRQALSPSVDLLQGGLADILAAAPDVVILADVARLAPAERQGLQDWVAKGGLLVRFAGPMMAAADPAQMAEDSLMPVRLRQGGHATGGAMSWGEAKTLAPFPEGSPFHGLAIPAEVTVRQQVLAQPDADLSDRTIALLTDGTPLVTRRVLGQGQVVLFHVTANAEWSSLPLSGLFLQMLERLAISTRPGEATRAVDVAGQVWVPDLRLDAWGQAQDAGDLAGVPGRILAQGLAQGPGPDLPPGLYKGAERRVALNVIGPEATLRPARWPAGTALGDLSDRSDRPLAQLFLTAALSLLLIDILASLALSGRLALRRRAKGMTLPALALLTLGLTGLPPAARAQDEGPADDFAISATSAVVLAHVLTGDAELDRFAEAGLRGLGERLRERTSVEPDPPMGVDIERDELAFFPFLYWPVTEGQALPTAAAYARLNAYLRSGGLILFDTRDGDLSGLDAATPESQQLQRLAAGLDIPPLEPVPQDHVLTRSFYLLQDFPGRHVGAPVWVEAAPPDAEQAEGMPFRNLNDGVTPVVIGGNDWAGAWAVDDMGLPLLPVGRGAAGDQQREMAYRFGINLIMHVLTGNYKSDQVHVPALLDRLGQ